MAGGSARPRAGLSSALVASLLAASLMTGCPSRTRRAGGGLGGEDAVLPGARKTTVEIVVPLGAPGEDAPTATLGAALYSPEPRGGDLPAVLFVPGGGRVSRDGVRPGDGVTTYDEPVAVTSAWAQAVALNGAFALAWDKRTCGPSDHDLCRANPTTDLDELGPIALARDVDAACAAMAEVEGFNGRIALWAHGQAVAVALASTCAKTAAALVLVAPVPRRIDHVMVETLEYLDALKRKRGIAKRGTEEGQLLLAEADKFRNAAGSTRAMFESMDKGQFAEDARVRGATLAFWRGWIELTDGAEQQVFDAGAPRVIVQGQWDLQFTPADRRAVAAWEEQEGITYVKIPEADHHLLTEGALADDTVRAALEPLWRALSAVPDAG